MTTPHLPRWYRATLWLTLVGYAVVAAMLWRVIWPDHGMTIVVPLKVMGASPIHAGDAIEVEIDYCADRDAFGWVGGVFASGGVVYPGVAPWPASLPKGCHVVRQVVQTPPTLRPGSYRWYMVRDYAPTVIATMQVSVMSEPFDVVARDAQ